MTERDLKASLKAAYRLDASERELRFVREKEQRQLRLGSIVVMQLKDLGPRGILAGLLLAGLALGFSRLQSLLFLWVASSSTPVAALLLTSGLGRARRCGMEELEQVTRFSARLLKCVRLFISGALGLALFAALALALYGRTGTDPVGTAAVLGWPYLLTAWACMRITRKVHGKESLNLCVAAGGGVALLPLLLMTVAEQAGAVGMAKALFIAALLMAAGEGYKYVKESEVGAWSWC